MARSVKGSHSFTCHPYTNHICVYSPAAEHHRSLAGTHCAYLRRDGHAELTHGWLYTEIGFWHRQFNLAPVTHPSTGSVYIVASLIETNALPLSQTIGVFHPAYQNCLNV